MINSADILDKFRKLSEAALAAGIASGVVWSPDKFASASALVTIYEGIEEARKIRGIEKTAVSLDKITEPDGVRFILEVGDSTPGGASPFGVSLFIVSHLCDDDEVEAVEGATATPEAKSDFFYL